MPRFRPKGALERSAAGDLWKHTLSRIPTVYGRLSYLAAVRDPHSGAYRHHGLAAMFGREEAGKTLRESHERVFAEWLAMSMFDKEHDLHEHLQTLEDPCQTVLDHLIDSRAYLVLVPDSARESERELFAAELEALLVTLRNGLNEDGTSPASSQPL